MKSISDTSRGVQSVARGGERGSSGRWDEVEGEGVVLFPTWVLVQVGESSTRKGGES